MPGLAGILAPTASPAHAEQARRMVSLLRHRPDCLTGLVHEPALGLHAGWVAHPGSFAARIAGPGADPSLAMLFAGECIGAPADLAAVYREHGDAFVAGLNGLFAGLLVDRTRRRVLLFNDRYGSERLYVAEHAGALYFASEAKALLAVLPHLRAFDVAGVADWLAFGSTLDGRTLFRGVALAPGGSLWRAEAGGGAQRSTYFRPAEWEALPTLSEEAFAVALSQAFGEVLPSYLDGSLPIGLSLTGGLDTRMIAACLPREQQPAVAYTYAAEGDDRLLDLRLARRIAGRLGIEHRPLRIGEAFLADFAAHVDRTVWISDGCAGVTGAHELSLSEQARALAPVRLTGNFGSEVLRSMSTFKRGELGHGLLDAELRTRIDAAAAEQQGRTRHPVTHAAFAEVPWHLFGTLGVCRSQLGFRTPFMDNRIVELAYRAPPEARRSPAACLRLVHDHDPALAELPTDRGVAWGGDGPATRLRKLGATLTFKLDYWRQEGLPDALRGLDPILEVTSSLGFMGQHKFLAYRRWFRRSLAAHARAVFAEARNGALPFWNRAALDGIVEDHVAGRGNRLREIHAVLTLEAVRRRLLDETAYREAAAAP